MHWIDSHTIRGSCVAEYEWNASRARGAVRDMAVESRDKSRQTEALAPDEVYRKRQLAWFTAESASRSLLSTSTTRLTVCAAHRADQDARYVNARRVLFTHKI